MSRRFVDPTLFGPWCLVLLIWQLTVPAFAQTKPQVDLSARKVLVLHGLESNVPIFELTDRGLRVTLDAGGIDIRNQFFEYLDLVRNPSPEYRRLMAELMRLRYGQQKIDFIITMYPEALLFALNEGRAIFREVPILALYLPVDFHLPGTNQRIIRQASVPEIVGTLEIALKLAPETRCVYVVNGTHTIDRWAEGIVRRDSKKWEGQLEFRYLGNLPLEEILTTVSGAPPETVVLLTAFQADVTGRNYTTKEVGKRLGEISKVPVFGLLDSLLGNGIAGGYLISFENTGIQAGKLALKIMEGRQVPETVSGVMDVPPVPMFDWRQLKRWNLSEGALPEGSVVINKELTLWDFRSYILGALAFLVAETVLIAVLIFQRRRKISAEESLRQKTEELDQFFNVSLDLLSIATTDGYFLRLNPVWEKILGYSRDELMSKRFMEFVHPDDVRATEEALATLVAQKAITYFMNRYRCKDGTYRWLEWSASPAGDLIYAAARDVTERKKAEEASRESERILRQNESDLRKLAGRLIYAQEEERSHLARELHDDLAQRLAVFAIDVGRLEQKLIDPPAPVREELHDIKNDIVRISQDVHSLSRQLHPSILDDLGLIKAVESECANFSRREGVDIVFNHENVSTGIPKAVSLSLYRIIQEGLRNISKHACAEHISVSLKGLDHDVLLSVQDDGIGFDWAEVKEDPGLGFSSMRERARLIGGDLSIQSKPEKGTVITLRVPLTREGE